MQRSIRSNFVERDRKYFFATLITGESCDFEAAVRAKCIESVVSFLFFFSFNSMNVASATEKLSVIHSDMIERTRRYLSRIFAEGSTAISARRTKTERTEKTERNILWMRFRFVDSSKLRHERESLIEAFLNARCSHTHTHAHTHRLYPKFILLNRGCATKYK